MANKIEIEKLDSLSANDAAAVLAINNNFTRIQEAINNTISRDGTVPNFMDADLDLNTHKIINGGEPTDDLDYVTLGFFKENVGESAANAAAAELSAQRAASSAQSANISAQNAFNSAQSAAGYVTTIQELVNGFDSNVVEKTQEFNDNVVSKTEEFNTNAANKQAQIDASADAAAQSAQDAEDSANVALEAATKASFGNIGDIKYTTRTEVPNGGAWCDGTEYTQAMFPDIYQMLVDGKISSFSYEDYAQQISDFSFCEEFALNTSTQKFKVPTVNHFRKLIKQETIGDSWYKLYDDGWLEQGGTISGNETSLTFPREFANTDYVINVFGAYNGTGSGGTYHTIVYSNKMTVGGISEDGLFLGQYSVNPTTASNFTHHWIALGYSEVPDSTSNISRAYVVLYSSAAEVSEVQAAEFINAVTEVRDELTTKANTDLSNLTQDAINNLKAVNTVDYTQTIGVSNPYTATTEGQVLVVLGTNGNNNAYVDLNSTRIYNIRTNGSYNSSCAFPVNVVEGDVLRVSGATNNIVLQFAPFAGGNNA